MTRAEQNIVKRQMVLVFLVGVVGILLFAYAYLLNATIVHGVAIEKEQKKLFVLDVSVGELEGEYFGAKKSVTLALARSLGFDESQKALFISRETPSLFSIRNEN